MTEIHPGELVVGEVVVAQVPIECRLWTKVPIGVPTLGKPQRFAPQCDYHKKYRPVKHRKQVELTVTAVNLPYVRATFRDLRPLTVVLDTRTVQLFNR